jgi:hypothetical protein
MTSPSDRLTESQRLRVDAGFAEVDEEPQRLLVQARVEDGRDLVDSCKM